MEQEKEDIIKKINAMLKFQGVWAEDYMIEKRKRLYEKSKAEKQRVKDRKQQKKE